MRFRIGAGCIDDYARLERFHYAAGRPAVPRRVLCARRGGEVVGVLVISQPTLNGSWRGSAWPGRFTGLSRTENARRVNAELRTIARVVIDPRCRGLGLATRLVRAYLADADTPCTEAVAAMGGLCPFFARAGMAEHAVEPGATDRTLRAKLERFGIDPVRLLDPIERAELLADARVGRALLVWARARGRSVTTRDAETAAKLAACRLTADLRAYTFTKPS